MAGPAHGTEEAAGPDNRPPTWTVRVPGKFFLVFFTRRVARPSASDKGFMSEGRCPPMPRPGRRTPGA